VQHSFNYQGLLPERKSNQLCCKILVISRTDPGPLETNHWHRHFRLLNFQMKWSS